MSGAIFVSKEVSILVLMDVPLQANPQLKITFDEDVVSILVLMDVPLQAGRLPRDCNRPGSFNPCFNGCTSSRLKNGH